MDEFYADYFQALQHHPVASKVLEDKVLPETTEKVGVADLSNFEAVTSVIEKQANGAYSESPYALYHDLKLATGAQLIKLTIGSEPYGHIHGFFRYAVDLLLREAARFSLQPPLGPQDAGDAFLRSIVTNFEQISTDVDEYYGEAYYVVSQSGPLFTSITGKASIDPRETEVHGTVHTSKLLAHVNSTPETILGLVSSTPNNFPHPAVAPTELLSTFTAPCDTPLAATRFIENDAYKSFAPTHDDEGALVDATESVVQWLERAGPAKQPTQAAVPVSAPVSAPVSLPTSAPESSSQTPATVPVGFPSPAPSVISEESVFTGRELDQTSVQAGIDPLSLLAWTPANFIDDDELQAAADGTELKLAARLLAELQFRQRERLAAPTTDIDISDDEWRTAFKAQNVLARLVAEAGVSADLGARPSTKLPVLMRNYAGTLPTAEPKPQRLAQMPRRR
ncbi:Chromatin structure-remodeling complex protein RSC58 [Wickerhamiella sorbophila]|uniref:Chromatin structure-remodeling complex protein RSC58 n=1 Tax=Wickerhamiella sorbophila TaxID=45607 RepID=A0A2T0FIC4_9ASCO|nr:Chromatin structure-remodeling complex protein RSC58 [Wickerhamiella sorbophila]PRT54751.1 Chromatin structure-remodeling complex protein RSC58 [Wickerhamiella sorbophila]